MTSDPRELNTDGYDTYESSQRAASYVTEILEKEAQLQAREKVSPKRRKNGNRLFMLAVPVFLVLTGMNVLSGNPAAEPLPPDAAMHEAQVEIYLAIQQVEAFKNENQGALPSTLEQIGADAPGLVFVPDVQGYEIVAEIDGTVERYVEGEDPTRFEVAAMSLFVAEDGSR